MYIYIPIKEVVNRIYKVSKTKYEYEEVLKYLTDQRYKLYIYKRKRRKKIYIRIVCKDTKRRRRFTLLSSNDENVINYIEIVDKLKMYMLIFKSI